MKLTTKSATSARNAVMGDYGLTPAHTGWSMNQLVEKNIQVIENCSTMRMARAYWMHIFLAEGHLNQSELRVTDVAIMASEASNIGASL